MFIYPKVFETGLLILKIAKKLVEGFVPFLFLHRSFFARNETSF